ncbi:MAG: hypothetical protein C4294_18425 [Nitrospiraceae bacterium]
MMPSVQTLRTIEEKWMDRLVALAQEAIEQTGVYGRRCQKHGWFAGEKCPTCNQNGRPILQRAQLSNFQNLAAASDSVEVIKLFVRYQMGRREGEGWKFTKGDAPRFGDQVIEHIDELERWAQEISPSEHKSTHLWLIRLYSGFLVRWYVALSGGVEEEREE